jgi:hypothetical protein
MSAVPNNIVSKLYWKTNYQPLLIALIVTGKYYEKEFFRTLFYSKDLLLLTLHLTEESIA